MARLRIDPGLDVVVSFEGVSIAMPRHRRRKGSGRRQRLRRLAGDTRREELPILDRIDVAIRPGEAVAILGTRQGGRDEFMRLAVGTLIPDSGTIRRREVITPMLERSRSLVGTITVRQNAYLLGGLLGMTPARIEERLPWIIDQLAIGKSFDGYLRTAPRLTRQKLVWLVTMATGARSFAIEDALVVGEPVFERRCWEHVESLKAQGVTFLLASDERRVVERFCDRALVFKDGRIIADTTPGEGLAIMPKSRSPRLRRARDEEDEDEF